jgi:hypothetical protein
MKKGVAIVFVLFILVLGIVSGDFDYQGEDLKKNYRAGETIKGTINFSLVDEDAESVLSSNFGGNITLIDFLDTNGFVEGEDYECSTANCVAAYSAGAKITSLNFDGDEVIGLKIVGDAISEIEIAKFRISGSLSDVCGLPLSVDVLNDKKNLMTSSSFNNIGCGSSQYGCFDKTLGNYLTAIIDNQLCEVIEVGPGPAYRIGARVTNSTTISGILDMSLVDGKGNEYTCELPPHTSKEQTLFCLVNASSAVEANFTVCVRDALGSGSDYRIKYEREEPTCGIPAGRDFEIFARPLQYDNVIVGVNESEYDRLFFTNLEDEIFEYLKDNYELDGEDRVICDKGCVVPIRLKGQSQTLQISDVNIRYRDVILTSDNGIYIVSEKKGKISADSIMAEIEHANFVIPLDSKKDEFHLFVNGNKKFEADITIDESFNFDISPKFAFLGLQTEFKIISSSNISSSNWNFGDGSIKDSSGESINYRYTKAGTFKVEVEAENNEGVIGVRTFSVVVGNPKESANKTIEEYKSRLSSLRIKIGEYPIWIQDDLDKIIEYELLSNSLDSLEIDFKRAKTDDEYSKVMNSLIELNVPSAIVTSKKGSLPLSIGFDNIYVGYIEEISGEEGESSEIRKGIASWYNENYDVDVDFEVVSKFSDGGSEDILTRYKIGIVPREEGGEAGYLLIDYPFDNVIFESSYDQKRVGEGSGVYIPVEGRKDIEFYVEEKVEVVELGAYISPEIRKLNVGKVDDRPTCDPDDPECEEPFPWKRTILWLSIIFVVFFVLYIIAQEWYKRNYENHLFKNKNDLYNLINFIYNSRVSGLKDGEIRKKLRETGWSHEKITYALKKIDGKRTGMWEIPLFKGSENRKVKKELEKRHGGEINTKFIKQPRF